MVPTSPGQKSPLSFTHTSANGRYTCRHTHSHTPPAPSSVSESPQGLVRDLRAGAWWVSRKIFLKIRQTLRALLARAQIRKGMAQNNQVWQVHITIHMTKGSGIGQKYTFREYEK